MTKDKKKTVTEFCEENPEWKSCPDLLLMPPSREELVEDMCYELDENFLKKSGQRMSNGATRGAFYAMQRINGSTHKFAEMLALQRGPALDTDDVFFSGSKPLYDQFQSTRTLNTHLKASAKHGFRPSPNSTYFPGLARFRGDPEAYVTRAQGRGYIKKLLESRGWACEGGVNVEHRQPESDPLAPENCVRLADDIIADKAKEMIAKDPSLKKVNRKDLRAEIIKKHGASI